MSNKLILAIAGLAVLALTTMPVKDSLAHTNQTYDTIIQRISDRFNVPEDQVQEVFDEVRADHHAQIESLFEDRLNTLVSEGELTEEQKGLLLAKREEMEAFHQNMKDAAPEERKETMQQHREEMDAWAQEIGIDLSLLSFKRMHHSPMMH